MRPHLTRVPSFLPGWIPVVILSSAAIGASPAETLGARGNDAGGEELQVLADGRFVLAGESAPLAVKAGLWVGALVDRGAGATPAVSGTLYSDDFQALTADSRGGGAVRYTDVGVSRPGHEPIGIEVTQTDGGRPIGGGAGLLPGSTVPVTYRLTNVSDRVDPAGRGWTLRNLYVGILADPDVGLPDPVLQRYADDQVAFEQGVAGGGVAYAFDEPGSDDDTAARFGIAVRGRAVHRFAALRVDAPTTEDDRYLWMRGDSDAEPTIDPASSRSADYRFLVTIGPIADVEPGGSVVFHASLIFDEGEAGPRAARDPEAEIPAGEAAARAPELLAAPNPASRAAGRVTLRGVPDGGEVAVYSVSGRLVRRLAGAGSGSWDLRATDGALVPAGVYYLRLSGGREPAHRIVVVR